MTQKGLGATTTHTSYFLENRDLLRNPFIQLRFAELTCPAHLKLSVENLHGDSTTAPILVEVDGRKSSTTKPFALGTGGICRGQFVALNPHQSRCRVFAFSPTFGFRLSPIVTASYVSNKSEGF
jgi:hypothetical protein